ncbi:glutamine--fructose-6-phosphate transaminase (isomerizing) [Haloferacaceae archaeon DSL9]
MCGIIACVGHERDTDDVLLTGLRNLEYRGYDSAGIGVANGDITVVKKQGELDELVAELDSHSVTGVAGIGHTRWSTHGPPSDANAHPHTDELGTVAVVHNGIIENYHELRDELIAQGVSFTSETDSEVVPHLIRKELDAGNSPREAFRAAVSRLEGSYALAVIVEDHDEIHAVRKGSPLVLGLGEESHYLASDVPAFLEYTREVVYLDDDEFVTIGPDGWQVRNGLGERVAKESETAAWDAEDTGKSGYDHYMLKEIHEQPNALRQALSGRVDELAERIRVDELDDVETPGYVQFVACGTSYHAALYGVELFRQVGIPASAHLASEYATSPPPLRGDELVIGVTQSGETADTLSAIREATSRGAETLALTNVVESSIVRECDHEMYIRAGPEIGVAATKTFTSQLVAINLLVERLAGPQASTDRRALITALRELPDQVQQVLDESDVTDVVEEYLDSESYFFIGRGLGYPVALEGALKFKEITYEHAEGFAAGELKHGPLALVTRDTPVFAIVTGGDEAARKTIGNVKEVEARDAPVIAVTDGQNDVERYADAVLRVPEAHARTTPVLANIQLQLVAYHVANRLGRSIDKPRNLAKSVTVE